MTDANLPRQLVQETRDALTRLLGQVRGNEMTAPAGMVARLEGAVWAIDALLDAETEPGERDDDCTSNDRLL